MAVAPKLSLHMLKLPQLLREYWAAVHKQWTDDYYAWLRANVRAEAWGVIAGMVAPAAATMLAYLAWPDEAPVTLTEAVVIAAALGAVGGLAVFFALLILTSATGRALAPYRVWVAHRKALDEWNECYRNLGEHYKTND